MTNPVAIVQVLLLFDEKNSAAYGPALWAALHEVEAFYNTGRRRMDVRRFYISPYVPASNFLGATWRLLFSPRDMANAIDLLRQDGGVARSPPLEAMGPDTKTYDKEKLVSVTRDKVLREHFADSMAASPLMIVTDTIITPPEDWRYMIWDSWPSAKPHDAVISTVHLDPAYWDIFDAHRVATIKNRTRTAAMSVCGEFLGLHLCLNRRCFLYDNVESVTDLDHMNRLGHEHDSELGGLSGGHFQGSAPDPNIVQHVALNSPGTAGG